MSLLKSSTKYLFYLSLTVSSILFVFLLQKLDCPLDTGDGLTHFFISKASFENPIYFLHHWGKPFFVLFTSSFAQFGFQGIIVFNIIVFVLSNVLIFRLAKEFKIEYYLIALFPFLYLVSYEIAHTVLSGMTEPFFNLILIFAFDLLVRKKWFWFAIVVGFCPFLRSEGQIVVVLGAFILIKNREWKQLISLAIPFLIYAIIGFFAFEDFWWYFNQSPYHLGNDIYGVGNWSHYFVNTRFYLTYYGLLIVLLGFISVGYFLLKREYTIFKSDFFIFGFLIFVGIFSAHVIFWAKGINGSIGLLRLATQGLPLFLFLNLILISKFLKTKQRSHFLPYSFVMLSGLALYYSPRLNIHKNQLEVNIISAAKSLELKNLKGKIFYQHPLLPFVFNENIFTKGKRTSEFITSHFNTDATRQIHKGDYIFWDPHTSASNKSFSKDTIEQFKNFVLVDQFGEGQEEVRIYQNIPVEIQKKRFPKISFTAITANKKVIFSKEFYDLFIFEKKFRKPTFFKTEIEVFKEEELFLSLSANNGKIQYYYPLKKGNNQFEINLKGLFDAKIFIWNKNKKEFQCEIKSTGLKTTILHPFVDN